MHPRRDQLLRHLICRAASARRLPTDLSAIDARSEFRRLLARVSSESSESEWSLELADSIGRSRLELARSGSLDEPAATGWEISNRQIRQTLIRQLARQADHPALRAWVDVLIQISTSDQDKREACAVMLGLLSDEAYFPSDAVHGIASGLVQLGATADDKRQARATLIRELERRDFFLTEPAINLVQGLTQLDPTADDRRRAVQVLFEIFTEGESDPGSGSALMHYIAELPATAEEKRPIRASLLRIFTEGTSSLDLTVLGIVLLAETEEDRRQARDALIAWMAARAEPPVFEATAIHVPVASFLGELRVGDMDVAVRAITDGLVQLDPSPEDIGRVFEILLGLLAGVTKSYALTAVVGGLAKFRLGPVSKRRVREVVLRRLADSDSSILPYLLEELMRVDAEPGDLRQAREVVLAHLATQDNTWGTCCELTRWLARLDPAPGEQHRAREVLLSRLADSQSSALSPLVEELIQLDAEPGDLSQVRDVVLAHLASQADRHNLPFLADALVQLDPSATDLSQARGSLLQVLTVAAKETNERNFDEFGLGRLVDTLLRLDPTAQDKRQARAALLARLSLQINPRNGDEQQRQLALLDPESRDLNGWHAWSRGPTRQLLAAVRQNSTLADWLAVLPSLSSLSGAEPAQQLQDLQQRNHEPLRGSAVGCGKRVPRAVGGVRVVGGRCLRRGRWWMAGRRVGSFGGVPPVVTVCSWTVRGRYRDWCWSPLPGNPRCCCVRVCQSPVLTGALAGGAPVPIGGGCRCRRWPRR